MDDLENQLRRHYESRQLSDGRVQEILAAGRTAARARRIRWRMAVAALVVFGLGILGGTAFLRGRAAQSGSTTIPLSAVTAAIAGYFSDPDYQLPKVSADRHVLMEWLRQHGGPADFEVPPAMAGLSSYGCQVLKVQGEQVYLICFLLDPPPANSVPGAMPEKKVMVVTGPDGRMMKKTVPLVHLVVAPKVRFKNTPSTGERMVLPAVGDWNFTAWTQGDQVFVAAAALPPERLAGLVKAL